jgi:tRNA (cmo5U34)-methyltransferase
LNGLGEVRPAPAAHHEDVEPGSQPVRPERGGYEWLSAERTAEYLRRERSQERRTELVAAHGLMLDLLPQPPDAAFRFLDLGAGAGAVSASVMARFPSSSGILVEFSQPMMRAGAEALSGHAGRYAYLEHDLNSEAWPAVLQGPFGAVVSARAIHHLENRVKRRVYRNVHAALGAGGVFVNWDLHRREDDADEAAGPEDRTRLTIGEHLDLLRWAGFVDVDCPHVLGHRAIFIGRRAW